jgi:hypothetical protein
MLMAIIFIMLLVKIPTGSIGIYYGMIKGNPNYKKSFLWLFLFAMADATATMLEVFFV